MDPTIILFCYVAYLLIGGIVEFALSRDTHFVTHYLRWDANLPNLTHIVPIHSWPIYLLAWIRYRRGA